MKPKLLPELWSRIFEAILDGGPSSAILPLLLVCKKWKMIGTPLLFRSITIRNRPAFEMLCERFQADIASQKNHPGKSTRTLQIDFVGVDQTYMGCIMIALTSMVQLQTLAFKRSILPSELYMLASNCGKTLETLQATFENTPVFPIHKYCRLLENFEQLKTLDIKIITNQKVESHYGHSFLKMPSLRTIRYTSWGPWHTLGLKAFCYMEFPALRELHLDLPHLRDCDVFLNVLFQNNIQLTRLKVNLPQDTSKRFMMLPARASKATLSFIPTLMFGMTCKFECIVFWADLDWLSATSRFLGDIATRTFDTMELKQIQVMLLQHFSWSGAGPSSSVEYSAFVGTMVHWSLRLKARGIDLLDQNGHTIDLRVRS